MRLERVAAAMMMAAGMAWSRNIEMPNVPSRTVVVCINRSFEPTVNGPAREIAGEMFQKIGLHIEWHGTRNCPAGAPVIEFGNDTSVSTFPGALAYAKPYEGIHILVFADRVRAAVGPHLVARLMAHVLVHELTHIFQGVCRHSHDGIMKPHWDANDYAMMYKQTMSFADEDIELITKGLDLRDAKNSVQ